MFVPVVCVTGKSAVGPPFLLILQPSNCTDGGVCSTPLRPLRNCSISISTSVKSSFGALFPTSMLDFLPTGHGSWKRGADAARHRPSPHTCTQCSSFLLGPTLWPAQDLNSFFLFVEIVCVTGKSAVDPPLLLILQPSNCTEGGVCSTPLCPL